MKKFSDWPLHVRLNVLVGTVIFFATLATTIFNYKISRNHWLHEINLQSRHQSALMLNTIASEMRSVAKTTDLLSDIVQHFTGPEHKLRELLEHTVSTSANLYSGAIIMTESWRNTFGLKKCPYSSPSDHPISPPFNCFFADYYYEGKQGTTFFDLHYLEPSFTQTDWYKKAMNTNYQDWIGLYRSTIEKNFIVVYAIPIYKRIAGKKEKAAIVLGSLALSHIQKLIDKIPIDHNSSVRLFDHEGNVFKPFNDTVIQKPFRYSFPNNEMPSEWVTLIKQLSASQSGTEIMPCTDNPANQCMFVYQPIPNTDLSLAFSYSISSTLHNLRQYSIQLLLLSFIALTILLCMISWICLKVTRPLSDLSKAAVQIGQGHFDQALPKVRHQDEVGQLISAFTKMQGQLTHYTHQVQSETAKRHRWEGEMDAASSIQMAMLPGNGKAHIKSPPLELWAYLQPAKSIGGDFYYFDIKDNGTLLFAIGDVSDKGMSAALFMAKALTIFKHEAFLEKSLTDILITMNANLLEQNDTCMFVTLLCGQLSLASGDMTFICAGHQPPYLIRQCNVAPIQTLISPAIGLMPDITFSVNHLSLSSQDKLFFYTDGIDEAFNQEGDMFGIERIEKVLQAHTESSLSDIGMACLKSVKKFTDNAPISDDMALMLLAFDTHYRFLIPRNLIGEVKSFHYKSDLAILSSCFKDIDHFLEIHSITHIANDMKLVIEELLNNCISYGKIPPEDTIALYIGKTQDCILIELVDSGIAFNPLQDAPKPSTETPQIGGLGVHLIKSLTEAQAYSRDESLNRLCVSIYYQ